MFLMAVSILKDPQTAQDAVQEAALKAYIKIAQLQDLSKFSTWITRILINECKGILRKKKFVTVCIEELQENALFSFDQEQWEFFDIVSRQKEHDRDILLLKYYYQFSLNEIAEVLSIPLSTVKSRLYRVLDKLKDEWR